MGRVQLVKSIVHGMLVYSFHIYRWPIRLLKMLDRWIKNFVWSGDIFTQKICIVSWNQVCLPWEFGGLDLKSTHTRSLLCYYILVGNCSRKTRNAPGSFNKDSSPLVSLALAISSLLFGQV